MSWKEQIEKIAEDVRGTAKMLRVLQGQTAINSKRIEALRVMIEQVEKTRSRSADRMADRLIEMAMVNQGGAAVAASHRRSLNEELPESTDHWQDSPEIQWPPPGCDAMDMP